MLDLQLAPVIYPTYTTVKVNNKDRRVRYFGAVTFYPVDGKPKVIREAGYYFIKNEPKTIYANEITDMSKFQKKGKGNDSQKKSAQ